MRELQRHQSTHWFSHDHTQSDGDGKFEISVEGKQDHENQDYGQGTNNVHLRSGLQKLAVFAARLHRVALGQPHPLLDSGWAVSHRPLQTKTPHTVLPTDVAGVLFAINKGGAVPLGDIGELAERDL